MRCDGCEYWVVQERTAYGDGSLVVNFEAPEGKGHCKHLDLDTKPDFGCLAYVAGDPVGHVRIIARKEGAPWQHSHSGPCPDCQGKGNAGDSGCHRCTGTGQVRYYDDGYIGEERTRLHPKEVEILKLGTPRCVQCEKELQVAWISCPYCGHRREFPAKTETVSDPLGGTNMPAEMLAKAAGDRHDAAVARVVDSLSDISQGEAPQ